MRLSTNLEAYLATKIPPPIVALIAAGFIWATQSLPPSSSYELNTALKLIFSLMFLIAGVTLDLIAIIQFIKQKTTINPLTPSHTEKLVTQGIYQYTRNPMYLGMVFLLTFAGVYLENIWAFLVIAIFMAYITQFQIKPEEKALESLFNDDFREYKQQVRMWL